MGHGSKSTTINFYAHATETGQQKAAGLMGEVLSGKPEIGYKKERRS